MIGSLRKRFWLETSMTGVTGILFAITLTWRDWIEAVFHIGPDQGNGTLEWLIVGALFVVTLTFLALAAYEWRRTRLAVG